MFNWINLLLGVQFRFFVGNLKIDNTSYETSFSETTNKNRKTIYRENGHVYRKGGLYSKDVYVYSI